MKKLIFFALAALTLTSCKKATQEGPQTSLPIATESYADINIKSSTQVVKMGVVGNQLNMVYNEDVTLLLDSNALAKSCLVHLKEDLGSTKLAGYNYHSMTKWGVNATNWVDDNLASIVAQSKDTVVYNRIFVKKRVVRTFIYQQHYESADAATAVMNGLLKQTDIMVFSAYYEPQNPDVDATTNTAKLIYVKI